MNIDQIYREESSTVLATLIRLLGDFDLADEVTQEAFAAIEPWPRKGVPENPRAWLVSTARHKAVDLHRLAEPRCHAGAALRPIERPIGK